jgi:hypothetical protein
MKEYRQGKKRTDMSTGHLHHGNPAMRELLKEGHRLDSFKWRISKLLSSQYEILLYVEYAPEYGVFKNDNGLWLGYGEEFCNDIKEVMRCYPTLKEEFKHMCDIGGCELFKVFLLRKYSPKFDWAIDCIVGVLDKAALLENLQKLPCQRVANGKRCCMR